MSVPATRIVTAIGDFIVESGKGRCWHGEEVAEFPTEVDEWEECGLCGKEIGRDRTETEAGK